MSTTTITTTQAAAEAAYDQLETAAPAAVAALLDSLKTALGDWTLWGCPRIQHACDERNLQCAEIVGWPILADGDRSSEYGYSYANGMWERRATHVLLSGGTLASLQREESQDGDYWTATPIDAADFPPADIERLTQTIQRAIAAHVAAVTERATENTRLAALAERLAQIGAGEK